MIFTLISFAALCQAQTRLPNFGDGGLIHISADGKFTSESSTPGGPAADLCQSKSNDSEIKVNTWNELKNDGKYNGVEENNLRQFFNMATCRFSLFMQAAKSMCKSQN